MCLSVAAHWLTSVLVCTAMRCRHDRALATDRALPHPSTLFATSGRQPVPYASSLLVPYLLVSMPHQLFSSAQFDGGTSVPTWPCPSMWPVSWTLVSW